MATEGKRIAQKIYSQDLAAKPFNPHGLVTCYRVFVGPEQAATLIDRELAEQNQAVDELLRAAEQYAWDTAGEQEDEEEIAKSLGRYAPASLRSLREAAARLRTLRGEE